MSEGKREASEKRETRATEEGLISRPTLPWYFTRSKNAKKKIAPVHGCVWVSRKSILACYTLRYNVSLGNIVSFESKKDYHVVVLRQLCVRNEVYS